MKEMNGKLWIWIGLIVIIIGITALLIIRNGGEEISDVKADSCTTDDDCAPANTCHPESCVLKSSINENERQICTQECKPGTLDCGQGYCSCVNRKCEAVIE